jgi:hypothetical protein
MMKFMRSGHQALQSNFLRGKLIGKMATGHQKIVFGIMVAIALIASCAQAGKAAALEPSYEGRSLSSWLADFDNPTSPNSEAMAAEAVRHIGSPALPFLIERLSESNNIAYLKALKQWRETQTNSPQPGARPSSPRWEAFCGIDALGVLAMPALSDLQKLLEEKTPNPAVLYLAVRTGPAGIPLLNVYLTNNIPMLSLEAKVLSGMIAENSEVLYPRIAVGPKAPSLSRRICELNLKVTSASFLEYSKTHPQAGSPVRPEPLQPPVSQVPDQ